MADDDAAPVKRYTDENGRSFLLTEEDAKARGLTGSKKAGSGDDEGAEAKTKKRTAADK